MDVTPEGRTYAERYQVHVYPHLAIIDPRTGRLLWRKEGWTQENPMTAELFAEIAMDFCSRNSFDRPPTVHRPPSATNGAVAARPVKRPMHQMSEDEQIQAAMQASLTNDGANQDQEMADGDDDDVEVIEPGDMKPAALSEKAKEEEIPSKSTFIKDLLDVEVGDEPDKGARMQLRMPDGKRKVRKFLPTATVRTIYAFLAVCFLSLNHLFMMFETGPSLSIAFTFAHPEVIFCWLFSLHSNRQRRPLMMGGNSL